ncbi:restriction endonuclease subunit S [Blautia sp. HCN-1074]|uniref:restriction endonuclease subunit S n=1 Tax=Blautia sp. HCN-1074 TaxID=3134667 RepID=UPI0030C486C0
MGKPEIRFKGYTDEWEQRKFGSLLEETRNKTTVEDEDTLLSCAIDGMYLNSELFSHFRGSSNIGYLKIKKNDLILSAQNLHLGNCNVNLRFEHGIISPAYKVYELVGCNPLFMQAWVKKDSTKDFFLKASTEGASVCRKNIVWEELYKQELPIPNIEEQTKVGEYFNSLDHLITLHQRKCAEIKSLKKYMLQKMFPQNEQKVPEIRFEGFTEAWEQRKLGEICESFEYGLNAAAKEYDGENKYIRITDIDDNSHEFIQDDVTSPDIDLTNSENYQLKYGDVLFARTGASVGKTYIYKESDGLVYYAGFLIRGRVKSNYSPEFIFQNTLTDDYDKFIRITSQRSGQPGVNAQEYASYEISVPKFEEQQKIGAYFSTLDHLITLHQQKCEELKKIKKFMLQKMFV